MPGRDRWLVRRHVAAYPGWPESISGFCPLEQLPAGRVILLLSIPQNPRPRMRFAFFQRVFSQTSSRRGASAKSASQRSGVMIGWSEPEHDLVLDQGVGVLLKILGRPAGEMAALYVRVGSVLEVGRRQHLTGLNEFLLGIAGKGGA